MKRIFSYTSLVLATVIIATALSSCLANREFDRSYYPVNDPSLDDNFSATVEQNDTGEEAIVFETENAELAGFGYNTVNNREYIWCVSPEYLSEGDAYCRFVIFNEEGNKRIWVSSAMQFVLESDFKAYNDSRCFSDEELDEILDNFDKNNIPAPGAKIAIEISHDESFKDSWISEPDRAVMVDFYYQGLWTRRDEANRVLHVKPHIKSFDPVVIWWNTNHTNGLFTGYRVVFYQWDVDSEKEVVVYTSKEISGNCITLYDFDYESFWRDDIDVWLNVLDMQIQGRKADSSEGDWYLSYRYNFVPPEWAERNRAAYPIVFDTMSAE